MTDDTPERRAPIEHPRPTDATVKQLYATAFRCGHPACSKPLYRISEDTGEYILNSRVAHIHARSEGGPRWAGAMSEAHNRSADNLIPLCEEHAFEIDATPDSFPADMLREWKIQQLGEHQKIHKSWPISDQEAQEVSALSFQAHDASIAHVSASAIVEVARAVGRLIATGRIERRKPQRVANEWNALRQRTANSLIAYDSNGELLRAEPAWVEVKPFVERMRASLHEAFDNLEPLRAAIVAELHALQAALPHLKPWCDWVERASANLLDAAARWPGSPPEDDDAVWPDAIADLRQASEGLTAAWRGEKTTTPPPPQPQEPTENAEQRKFREHSDLLDRARPWARVNTRPYDPDLYQALVSATSYAVALPEVLRLMPFGLQATTGLAAKVARNTDDETLRELAAQVATRQPLAAALYLLRELMFLARDSDRQDIATDIEHTVDTLIIQQTWTDENVWLANGPYAYTILTWWASMTDNDTVRDALSVALNANPHLLPLMVDTIAQWSETMDITGQQPMQIVKQLRKIPAWFPTEAAIEIAASDDTDGDSMVAKFVQIAKSAPDLID